MSTQKQIVVVKGWEGFADRLQILAHCMQYAMLNNAALWVDWRDEMWGQKDSDFNDYFQIVGIETVTIDEVTQKIKSGATVYPPSWTETDISTPMNKYISMKNSTNKFEDVLANYTKLPYDVIVVKNGLRKYNISHIINNLRIRPDVSAKIQHNLANVLLPFTAVHLRGTDRMNGSVSEIITQTTEKYNSLCEYEKARVYVISDMRLLAEAWINGHPNTLYVNPHNTIFKIEMGVSGKKIGSHMLPKEVYDYYGVSKYNMNIDTITDFIALAMANWYIGNIDTESCFTKMARFVNDTVGHEGIVSWLGDYVPIRGPITIREDDISPII